MERLMFLENAKRVALETIKLDGYQVVGSRQSALLVGLGYAAAEGWAMYSGNGEFQITADGVKALAAILNPK